MDFIKNGVFVAIIGHGLIGLSLLWDKILLKQPETRNLVSYVFWLGAISIFGLLLIPFGFELPSFKTALLAFTAGLCDLGATFFYYQALKAGEASQTLAIMGGFSPVATALIAIPLLKYPVGEGKLLGFALMTIGGFVMFFSEHLDISKIWVSVVAASGLFGLVNVLQKLAYNDANFVTAYVFFSLGTFAGAILLLVRRTWRKQIFTKSHAARPRSQFWYFVNRFTAGVGSFLVFFAISRENPAVVDAIAGVRYAVIFTGALAITKLRPRWLKEDFRGWALVGKSVATLLVVAGLVLLALAGGEAGAAGPA